MHPHLLAALLAAAALPAAAQTTPAPYQGQAPAPSQGQAPSMSDMPRADGGGYARTPPTPQMRAARQAVRQQCAADMARLCADVMPAPAQAPAGAADGAGGGGGRRGGMMQCIRQHRSEVSQTCSQALDVMRAARMSGGQPPAGDAPPAVPPQR